jgi:hypothetical protein
MIIQPIFMIIKNQNTMPFQVLPTIGFNPDDGIKRNYYKLCDKSFNKIHTLENTLKN